ncbi:histone-lysine N-methyltransferase, H3 lysine-9 specific SUVH1-like [Arachis stenosperma]|uniref:histone-lysine N-methyltransferase, H3 lysine-9 specific SUVH1-like n=1 Tax=Arachis stenosperma TaxID=217475 RepID=UPI0025AC1C6F|nr:histone-lysine N-methyltransferase, H3 lysine-9 specific SUVH1-like [Arachis stenosperma]
MEEGLCQNSSDSVNKLGIVDVKPLRSLAPVFPESTLGSTSAQPPYGFSPFLPVGVNQESRASPAPAPAPVPAPAPAPVRSFRSSVVEEEAPRGADGDGSSSMEGISGAANDRNHAAQDMCGSKPPRGSIPAPVPLRSFRSPLVEEETLHGGNGDGSSSVDGLDGVVNDQNCMAPHMRGCKSSNTSIPAPTPLRVYRSPLVEEVNLRGPNADAGSSFEGFNGVANAQKRSEPNSQGNKSSQKRSRVNQDSDFVLSSSISLSLEKRSDADRETVNFVLMTFDALRRRLLQLEEAKELNTTGVIKRADLRASNTMTLRGVRTNLRRRIGVVPGIEIGDIFYLRMELCLVGLHGQTMSGIDYATMKCESQEEPLALSIVSSGEYDDDTEDNDILVYSGQGDFHKKDKNATDQKLQRGNLALDKSSQRHNEVRVIRGLKDATNKSTKIYVYDGLYKIQDSWIERGKSGGGIFKYKFVRLPEQPSAFAVWKSVQKWKEGTLSRSGLIIKDLSSGIESIPVSLVNEVDNAKGPGFFTYVHSLKNPKPFGSIMSSHGCNCNKACVPGDLSCSCIQRNVGDFPYIANGFLVSRKPLVHECGSMCRCLPNCKNRVSQSGLKHYMEVFKTLDRGWGLRSLDPIRAGTFICEYAGEVVDRAKLSVNGREGDNEYIFDTSRIFKPFKWNYEPSLLEDGASSDGNEDYDIQSHLIISAKDVGNVARFMNHSCSPNVFWQPVVYHENNQSFLHIAFFALRHIPPMTELTYDYGVTRSGHAEGSSSPKGRKKCFCGSPKCYGSFG